jgi:hypothetical protein
MNQDFLAIMLVDEKSILMFISTVVRELTFAERKQVLYRALRANRANPDSSYPSLLIVVCTVVQLQ